jgi:lipoprotein NlpI
MNTQNLNTQTLNRTVRALRRQVRREELQNRELLKQVRGDKKDLTSLRLKLVEEKEDKRFIFRWGLDLVNKLIKKSNELQQLEQESKKNNEGSMLKDHLTETNEWMERMINQLKNSKNNSKKTNNINSEEYDEI